MFILPELPYEYNALEPHIDEETMHLHHDKHHATYVKNLNDVLAGYDEFLSMSVEDLLKNINKVPDDIKTKVLNNGGQHANHSLFWTVMNPVSGEPKGMLLEEINKIFGSFSAFKEQLNNSATTLFGSGWIWLSNNNGKLKISVTSNADTPLLHGSTPLLVLDVWEHAYYLKYQNRRTEYIEAWWNVVNWSGVEKRFESARA